MDVWPAIAAERRALADDLDMLTPEQWAAPSLCAEWTVRDVAAHLVVPHTVSLPKFMVTLVRSRGSFPRANIATAARVAVRPTAELVADLRRYADGRFTPPGSGPEAPLTDVLVHSADIRIPLGIADPGPPQRWTPVLDFLVSPRARRGFVSGPLPQLTLVATDADWTHGSGPEVRGPAAAIALALLGRPAVLTDLSGPGKTGFSSWAGR
jgi:uncharacterized protein (TIGR03083 family)